jgi:nucleoside-diphosphate-sugar epimerase
MKMLKPGTRVLLTGGAGFIGSHVARRLATQGCLVRVLDDLSTGKRERLAALGARLELMHADVRNANAVEKAARGAEVIVHLAASPIGADPMRAQEVQLGGALNILNAARAADKSERPRVVLCGSGSVYGKQTAFVLHEELAPRPSVPQAVMALAAEQYGRVYREAYGVQVTNLRIFRTFGPDEDAERADASVIAKFIRAALDGSSPVIHGDGQQTRDLVYVENVVNAIFAACTADHADPLNVASGEAVSINHLWNLVLELAGKKRLAIEPTYVPAPPWDPKHARPQIQKSCKDLNWAPSVRLRDGIQRTVQYFLAQRSADPNAWFAPRSDATPPPRPMPQPPAYNRPRTPTPPPITSVAGSVARKPPSSPVVAAPMKSVGAPKKDPTIVLENVEPIEDETRVDDDLSFEWAPVPAVPGMGR